eukprot:scaffold70606_cov60-Phaeocystis_antarctica.AAC.3
MVRCENNTRVLRPVIIHRAFLVAAPLTLSRALILNSLSRKALAPRRGVPCPMEIAPHKIAAQSAFELDEPAVCNERRDESTPYSYRTLYLCLDAGSCAGLSTDVRSPRDAPPLAEA